MENVHDSTLAGEPGDWSACSSFLAADDSQARAAGVGLLGRASGAAAAGESDLAESSRRLAPYRTGIWPAEAPPSLIQIVI